MVNTSLIDLSGTGPIPQFGIGPEYHFVMKSFRFYAKFVPQIDIQFFRYMAGYLADVFRDKICPLLAIYGVDIATIATISKLFYGLTRKLALRHTLQQMIMNQTVWTFKNQQNQKGRWNFFIISTNQLYGNFRKIFKRMPVDFKDIENFFTKMPVDYKNTVKIDFEQFLFQNLRDFITFHPDGLINNILFPSGVRFKKRSRSKK
eukprot:TRINITY_DN781_c0_g2_i4.p1 TRINITY_DN781_c0_g2~~TRINITY_DN781_c0_g2_i4.p1  ORF type:complete len:220 (+),score=24.52 TRINITY_DN781_c0_g2_i4:51-662(+)